MENEFLERFEALEKKVDVIHDKLNQAIGAWIIVKIVASVSLGCTVLYNFIVGHWK